MIKKYFKRMYCDNWQKIIEKLSVIGHDEKRITNAKKNINLSSIPGAELTAKSC
ncbi:MAG: hypothetical protein PUB42_04555 [Firmicutes bacterium]|nr:hypothetical protein [Bacillota bacterium]